MRVIFMGTPDFAVGTLEAIVEVIYSNIELTQSSIISFNISLE